MRRESHAQFCERLVVKSHRPTLPFGPHRYNKKGGWYLGASSSKKNVQRFKANVASMTSALVPSNMAP